MCVISVNPSIIDNLEISTYNCLKKKWRQIFNIFIKIFNIFIKIFIIQQKKKLGGKINYNLLEKQNIFY